MVFTHERQVAEVLPTNYFREPNILALDMGKYKTVFCEYNADNGEHTFGTVKTRPQEIHDLIVGRDTDRVVLEVCSIAGWVVDIAEALGKETETACAMHDAWRWKNVKKKTDRQDALKLARLSSMGQARDLEQISDVMELWRGQLHVELGLLEAVAKSVKAVERKLDKMGASDERVKRLQTINGVGPRLAETVVAFLDDPRRFKNGKDVGSYAGLVPRQYQSGQMERQGRTGGRGDWWYGVGPCSEMNRIGKIIFRNV